jgi:3-phytase
MNNIDLRSINNKTYIFATDSSTNTINLWVYGDAELDRSSKAGKFSLRNNPDFSSDTNFLAYGACAGISEDFGLIVFVTEAKGPRVQLWNFKDEKLNLLQTFNNSNAYESEGCVYDDENNIFFISEENKRGVIRSYSFSSGLVLENEIIIDDRNGNIVGDPEGLAILKTSDSKGYLIASSQGNSTFNVYDRQQPHKYITSFKIDGNKKIDAVSDTDGIEIVNLYLNKDFPDGIMVVQDGMNTGEKTIPKENFKYISLTDVKALLPY